MSACGVGHDSTITCLGTLAGSKRTSRRLCSCSSCWSYATISEDASSTVMGVSVSMVMRRSRRLCSSEAASIAPWAFGLPWTSCWMARPKSVPGFRTLSGISQRPRPSKELCAAILCRRALFHGAVCRNHERAFFKKG